MSVPRCFDCFHEFAPDEQRFAVLKQMRDKPEDVDPVEWNAFLFALAHDQVFVCRECAGWYGDHSIPVTEAEAQQWGMSR